MVVEYSVKVRLSKEEKDAVKVVYLMLHDLMGEEEQDLDRVISTGASLEDVQGVLYEIYQLAGGNADELF